ASWPRSSTTCGESIDPRSTCPITSTVTSNARRRAKKDRSTWLQEAAEDYLKRRTRDEEVEAWLSAEERVPLTEDERSFIEYGAHELGRRTDELDRKPRGKTDRTR